MGHKYHLTRVSGNAKTGPIPVSTTSKSTCPDACPLKRNGCYAESGPIALHWGAVSTKGRGYDLEEFCSQIKRLPRKQLWRYGQAGDLPGEANQINFDDLEKIVEANQGRNGFAYTHYPADKPENARAIAFANSNGFVINLSADSLNHADKLADLGVAPVVTLLPEGTKKPVKTPAGRQVSVCPASIRNDINCATCGICATQRKAIIGFPVHGAGKGKAQKVFMLKQV